MSCDDFFEFDHGDDLSNSTLDRYSMLDDNESIRSLTNSSTSNKPSTSDRLRNENLIKTRIINSNSNRKRRLLEDCFITDADLADKEIIGLFLNK